jgi:carbon storage regulator
MLVLTRKEGEVIVIDGRIRVAVVAIRGKHVHVGVDAPADVPILRAEIAAAIAAAAKTPAAPGPQSLAGESAS